MTTSDGALVANFNFRERRATTVSIELSGTVAAPDHPVSLSPSMVALEVSDLAYSESKHAVSIEGNKIVGDPSKMIRGIGYPVIYRGRQWWVVNVDGDLIRFYKGPKA